jgi:hypothetical protein
VPEGQYPVNLCSTAKIADKVCKSLLFVNSIIIVRFEVFTVVTNKTVLWVVTACSLVGIYHLFRGNCCLHLLACIFLQDADKLLPYCMVSHPRKWYSSPIVVHITSGVLHSENTDVCEFLLSLPCILYYFIPGVDC